jgi:hypothetical protein
MAADFEDDPLGFGCERLAAQGCDAGKHAHNRPIAAGV